MDIDEVMHKTLELAQSQLDNYKLSDAIRSNPDVLAYVHTLLVENAELKSALTKILEYDTRSMYERCPDCDYPNECKKEKRCKCCPNSTAGEIASKALGRE